LQPRIPDCTLAFHTDMARAPEMFQRRPPLLLAGALLACLAGPAAPQEDIPAERFREDVTVRDVELIVELPANRASIAPSDLQVIVDGEARPVARTGPLDGETEPWSLLIYVDRVLAGPDTVHTAAIALAKRAETLVELGTVEVAVADPEPRRVLTAVRGAFPVSEALAPLAAQTRRASGDIGARAGFRGFRPPPEPEVLRRQLDALIAFAAAQPARGPRALLLVADGLELSPQALAALEAGQAQPEAAANLAEPFVDAARALAAYGWITLALPLQPTPDEPEPVERTDIERFRELVWEPDGRVFISFVPWIRQALGLKARRPETPRETTLAILPWLAPLRAISTATGGELAGYESQLDLALAELWRRWTVSYPSSEPLDGRLQPVQVRYGGTELAAPTWTRSSIPLVVTEARLRRLLAAAAAPTPPDDASRPLLRGDLPLAIHRRAGERALRLTFPTQTPTGPIRIALAAGPEIRHETHPPSAPAAGLWSHTLTVPPTMTGPIALIVEDLAHERWAGKVLELD
jgi:hypothetical protein